jgi:hypothetical protein
MRLSRDLFRFAVLACACVGLTLIQHHLVLRKLVFPPGLDQDWYLAAARDFGNSFVFMWRAPLYSAWLGTIWILAGRDTEACFYVDRAITVAVLALVTSCLVWRLAGFWTALAACVWTLDLKYLLRETNNSHAFAAVWVGCALLSLSLFRRSIGWPWAAFGLFLGACARREILVPLVILVLLGITDTLRSEATKRQKGRWRHWLICALMAVGLWGLFRGRPSHLEHNYFALLLSQQFSVNYVERHNLHREFPDKWSAFNELIPRYFPDVSTPMDMIWKHPDEVVKNVEYNLRLAPRALLANTLGLEHFVAVAAVVVGSICLQRRHHVPLPERQLRDLALWTLALHVIVLVNLLFRVISRYNLALVSAQIAWAFVLSQMAVARIGQALARRAGALSDAKPR